MPSENIALTSVTRSSRSKLPAYPISFPILLVFPDAWSSAWKVVSIHRVEYPGTFSYGFYAMAAGETPKVAPSRKYLKGGESDSDETHPKRGSEFEIEARSVKGTKPGGDKFFELQVMARLVGVVCSFSQKTLTN